MEPLKPTLGEDEWKWLHSPDGNALVKDVKRAIRSEREDGRESQWDYIWKSDLFNQV